ncbi:CDP-alcohol phosphatidyltransferase family protein [Clostridium sp. CM028]|uniref:CDP-alcohol phosphatidyltransferase family protein n=1 Tax=Clostridium sp. CM028 TaxID=2851575 RepID=UPI001C6F1C82|nr:CDP-alcohol phosphatidyltransferase family protein [Clostridium sp. CM028]MBW9148145.1 CDP-alcohol phosphatidyltransferase family protein [Clostridium sp. CM028]WLC62264.1 CDP-alcohol phosphatidyltransferase family protein [Clostridium sp. CM028]
MKTIANYISIARIFFSITLLVAKPLSIVFFAIYLVCGISDVFDGYIARKTDTASKLGEKLDSVADLIMVVILTIVLYPIINSIINPTVQIIVWVVIIGIVRVVSMIVVFVKYKTFGILHTYGNKITGLVLFAFPLSLAFSQSDVLMYIICMVASAAAFEELFIHLLSNELQANKKSIFLK